MNHFKKRQQFDLDFLGAAMALMSPEILKRQIQARLATIRPPYRNCVQCTKKNKVCSASRRDVF